MLGASFSIQTDQNAEYVDSLVEYVRQKAGEIEQSAGSNDALRTAILTAVLLADELFQQKADPKPRSDEVELFTKTMIERIDSVLEESSEPDLR